ncbi:MAG: hypothetical protein M3R54_09555 [Chloroflexota bacterium]|nr:hypothetical protein [Chloroflexota bacterium]
MRRLGRPLVLALLLVNVTCGPSATPAALDSPTPAPTFPPSQAAPEAAGCPVTLPASSWVAELARFTPLPASRFTWYGDTKTLAVDLPIDGVYRIQAGEPTLSTKIAWWRYVPGTVQITARSVDGASPEIRTSTTAGYGDSGFNPSGIDFTSEGCWRVNGNLEGHQLTFVMLVRRSG